MDKEYGVRYRYANSMTAPIITKEKIFSTQKQLDAFVKKLEQSDGFIEIESWLFPKKD